MMGFELEVPKSSFPRFYHLNNFKFYSFVTLIFHPYHVYSITFKYLIKLMSLINIKKIKNKNPCIKV